MVGNECDDINFGQFCGLVKCDILPPKNLYFPVLPCKFNGKLIFTLCHSCVFNTQEQHEVNINCQYLDEERTLTGVWCSPEIKRALEMGYERKKVYKLYHYESVGDIFSSFVKYFSKLKQKSSGFPACCCDQNGNLKEKLIDKFSSDYSDREGTRLDRFEMQEI